MKKINKKTNKKEKDIFSLSMMRNKKGQVSVIIILFVAIGLILYAATTSVSTISASKTMSIKASNMAAAQMASLMASYGEKLFREQLGGKTEICKKTSGWLSSVIVNIAIWVAVILLSPFPFVYTLSLLVGFEMLQQEGLMTIPTLHSTYIQPKITHMWNKQQVARMETTDSFVEQGIQAGLQNIVSDHVQAPDINDADMDGKYGYLTNTSVAGSAGDYIARFAYYNTARHQLIEIPDGNGVRAFLTGLKNFV